jgi:MraZ protein
MKLFLSTYHSKLDIKHRLSIPASFRSVIKEKSSSYIYAYPSFVHDCIEVCTSDMMESLQRHIESLDLFSEEREALATAVLGGGEQLLVDLKGRVGISERLFEFAGLDKEALFVGKGNTFEIWAPDRFKPHFAEARKVAKDTRIRTNR